MTEQTDYDDEDFAGGDIAIVGIACRFPDARNPLEFWRNLRDGHESRTELTEEELLKAGVSKARLDDPAYVRSGMFLQDMECFDAGFFGFSPRDAAIMDPQHRHFLENCWEALENAGHNPQAFDGSIGVFAGSGHNAYLPYNLLTNPKLLDDVGFFLLRHTGNDKDFLTTRVSYCLNLKGPSINIQTACSTSLVAVHTACQSLVSGECDMALAGGVTIELPHRRGYLYQENEILSPDGHCRPFDADSDGTVFGSGVGVVVLRRLEDALAEGDNIQAIICSSAINNDGSGKVSYLAPSVDGQAAVVIEALEIAEIDPQSVSYIECHGTATRMGDPIEVEALTQAYGAKGGKGNRTAIGSVKSNIGHLDTAAGVAGIIKLVQSLKHRQLPPTLHYKAPNPAIDFSATPFYVNNRLQEWESEEPLRAGISSLGVGGTNVHILLEEAPAQQSGDSRRQQLLVLSARSQSALAAACARYVGHFAESEQVLADIAYTAALGRKAFPYRCCVAGASAGELKLALESKDSDKVFFEHAAETVPEIIFMFAGGGAQYPGMGLDLYEQEPVYRKALDDCLQVAQDILDFDLRAVLFPPEASRQVALTELERPSRALPALFITQYAQVRLWQSWGINPRAFIGHSMGEYTAACLAGVFSVRDALAIVSKRGSLFEELAPGAMLSVMIPEAQLKELLASHGELSIAAVNAPELCVVSGPETAIALLTEQLNNDDVACQRIHISVAAHSAMLEPILAAFRQFLMTVKFQPPAMPVVSNLTGAWLTEQQACDPDYWVQHLRQTVRFADGIDLLLSRPQPQVLLEVGPGNTLASVSRQHPAVGKGTSIFNSMRHVKQTADDQAVMLAALGRLWGCGAMDDWQPLYKDQQRLRVELPTYPFEHQSYWIEPGAAIASEDPGERQPLERWAYQPGWQPVAVPGTVFDGKQLVVMFGQGDAQVWPQLQAALDSASVQVVRVSQSRSGSFSSVSKNQYELDASCREHYLQLFTALGEQSFDRINLVHGWTLGQQASSLDSGFFALLAMAQAVAEQGWDDCLLSVISSGSLSTGAGDALTSPLSASMLGTCRVLHHEVAGLAVRYIDIDELSDHGQHTAWLPAHVGRALATELLARDEIANQAICYRKGQRYSETYTVLPLPQLPSTLRDDACYIITGGFGGLGMELARQLAAQQPGIKLALLGRSPLPDKAQWQVLKGRSSREAVRIRAVEALEASGATVGIYAVDITDQSALGQAITEIVADMGAVYGVFHTAGVINDSLLAMKNRQDCERVLAPKVQGTVALLDSLAEQPLDFVLLYSSTSAIAGVAGQVDYAAANAFLDAYAQYRRSRDGLPVTSINWSAWQQVGMAAELAEGSRHQGLGFARFDPVCVDKVYRRCLSSSDWLLDEHRTKAGLALMPGTGHLEMIRQAAVAAQLGDASQVLELQDVFFLAPLNIRDGEQRIIEVAFTAEAGGTAFSLKSAMDPESVENDQWLGEHVQGRVVAVAKTAAAVESLDVIQKRCQSRVVENAGSVEHHHMDFGGRWQCLQKSCYGDAEVLAELVLPDAYVGDLADFSLHPALLDMTTAAGFELAPNYQPEKDFFVPISYGCVSLFHPLQQHLFSRMVFKHATEDDRCCYDLELRSADGTLLVAISDFMVKRMSHDVLDRDAQQGQASSLQQELQQAITPGEGGELISRLLVHPEISRIVISPLNFEYRFAQQGVFGTDPAQQESIQENQDRPELSSGYIAPESAHELALAELWRVALGIADIGVEDNFFELGGHSLMLTQLVSKAKKQLGLQVSLSRLFDKPTIKNWLSLAATSAPKPKTGPIKRVSRDGYKSSR